MKGGLAGMTAAAIQFVRDNPGFPGSIALLVTGDEEGPAVNGTVKLLEWAAGKGEKWDAALVGEPTNPDAIGDMIKIGRRGSMSGTIIVYGIQGHAAYPQLTPKDIRAALAFAAEMTRERIIPIPMEAAHA